ncbi:sulfatase-like hydrolase/transferase [Cylindrospermopsis raciborskii UAM/DH-BiRr]|uniref:sulfatase-like hydrolase/transferase n=1 Tax=Cylindrospermopsis raciborskii TaxID=77022 RepID=UPI00387A6901
MGATDFPAKERPNIVFILADDLGWGDLSIDGQKNYQTPYLDQLARDGIRFNQAYSDSPVCTPTRIGFFTGRYPGRLAIGNYEPLLSFQQIGDSVGLPPEHPTIASLLRDNGYETVLVGKWHCGYLPRYSPLKSGFNKFFGNFSGAIDYFRHVDTNGKPDLWEADTPIEKIGYVTDIFTERAVDFIKGPHVNPFYLSLHYTAPHWPWQGPEDVELSNDLIGRDNLENWINTGTKESYKAVVQSLDNGVGKVLQALEDVGIANRTIVIFASDNGGERFSNFGLFQGKKGNLYEGGIRVPTLIRWSGVIAPNQISDQVIITHDITATILAATKTNTNPDYPLDGEDLLPVIQNEIPTYDRVLFWRYKGNNRLGLPPRVRQGAVRSENWKYLKIGENEHLFNLANDQQELINLKLEHREIFAKLRSKYQLWESELEPY